MATTVLFACVHNAGRSQMAAAFFNQIADPSRARGVSAGMQPAKQVHANVVKVMREVVIDLHGAKPRRLTDELAGQAQVLVTMGCGGSCPVIAGVRVIDWNIPDPKDQPPQRVREIRDEIRHKVTQLVMELETG